MKVNVKTYALIGEYLGKDLFVEERHELYAKIEELNRDLGKTGFKIIEELGYIIEWVKHENTGKSNWLRISY